jgi:hypothetical protein
MSDLLDDMKLPSTNSNEELEDLSNNAFISLFDVTLFYVRPEPGRDKGIDFRIELKRDGRFTGFQFLVQLKSTKTLEKNEDGSISLQLSTHNINYLLNPGISAYYVLYYIPETKFYYERLNDFVKVLSEQKNNWQDQDNHTLRFKKEVSQEVIVEMYHDAYNKGKFFRQVNERLALSSSLVPDKLLVEIDENLQVSSDSEIRQRIEKVGLHWINNAAWTTVIELHRKASHAVASTAKYNLVVGIAYYYSGELLQSLHFLKKATQSKHELPSDLQEHLDLFELSVRLGLGMITKTQYDERTTLLQASNHLKYYIKIEKEKAKYLNFKDEEIDAHYEDYTREMNNILLADDANENIKLFVRCDMILYEGSKINLDTFRLSNKIQVTESILGIDPTLRSSVARGIAQRKMAWVKKSDTLRNEAIDSNNAFILFLIVFHEAKVFYEFEAYAAFFRFDNSVPPGAILDERSQGIREEILNLEEAIEYFRQISYIGNLCTLLALKYEMLHFINDMAAADAVAEQLSGIIETYELADTRYKLDALKNKGTTHEKIAAFVDDMLYQARERQNEYNKLIADMKSMDQQDQAREIDYKNLDFINLHPIGPFSFPKTERNGVYDLLNISVLARKDFDRMLDVDKAIPVANLYNTPIDHEGIDGIMHSNEIAAWRNIYRIRKTFFEKGFNRYHPNRTSQ